jgi:ribosomal protein L17
LCIVFQLFFKKGKKNKNKAKKKYRQRQLRTPLCKNQKKKTTQEKRKHAQSHVFVLVVLWRKEPDEQAH